MILSVSRRTDVPAFYSDWFLSRVQQGFVCVRNPRNPRQVSRVDLRPEVVDCIVFWSKNPAPLLPHLGQLGRYAYYVQYTLNDYGGEVEPGIPPLKERVETFIALARQIGKERVIWRYDPILFSQTYTPETHLASFEAIAKSLRGHTEKCVISLVDRYPTKNAAGLGRLGTRMPHAQQLDHFFAAMAAIARENGLALASCAEALVLEKYGIAHNSCIDRTLIERITGAPLRVGPDGQRPGCLCVKCEDIGAYDTCPCGCAYCYANFRPDAVQKKRRGYDVDSPMLCDGLTALDKVTARPARSFRQEGGGMRQLSLF